MSGGRRVPLPGVGDAVAGTSGCWSAGVGREREPFKGGGDFAGPGPVPGEAENPAPASGHELAGCGQQAGPQATRFPESRPASQGEHGHPGQQVERDLDDLHPDLVLGGVVRGQVAQAGGPGGPDPVLGPCPKPVTELELGDRPAGGVGREARDPHAVRGRDPQLGSGMWPFLSDDQSYALGPAVQQLAGKLGDPGPVGVHVNVRVSYD